MYIKDYHQAQEEGEEEARARKRVKLGITYTHTNYLYDIHYLIPPPPQGGEWGHTTFKTSTT